MTSTSATGAAPTSSSFRPRHRPSFSSRSLAAGSFRSVDSVEAGNVSVGLPVDQHFEEIEAIKRYEDFTTIDWVQDAARAQLRRRLQQQKKNNGGFWERGRAHGWRRRMANAYEAGQAWIVVSLIGACIGLNAAFLNIVTEWLSDFKHGHCTTAFYLNESFCCWGAEKGCDEWRRWSSFGLLNYLFYILFSIFFAYVAAILVRSFAPYAAGSGISEIKCIIGGFIMKGFLSWQTLLIKSIGLPLAIASGLSVGKEGPSVHYAVCTGNVVSRFFSKYRNNAAKMREIMSACAAAGVAVAFGSPIGGVLFSLEEMAPHFPLKTMWRSYFCALVATAVLAAMNPFRTGQLVMFQVSYDRDWHFFEVVFFVLLGIFGGLYGEFVIKWNLRAQAFRKKYLKQYAIEEVTFLAGITAVICYSNMFLRIDMTENMEILFHECEGQVDYEGLCEPNHRWRMVFSLTCACIIRTFLVIISYGCKVPAGIFVPSMAIGATFGRLVGILVQALHEANPDSRFFASCKPDIPCITPGTYAFLGAAAALSGIMHITVSVVVIMFELTGALTYILPTMIVVGVTKAVTDRYGGKGGIADRMIWFNGFPFLDTKDEHSFGVPVSRVMIPDLVVLPGGGGDPTSSTSSSSSSSSSGWLELREVQRMLESTRFQGFPVVRDLQSKLLLGYLGRTELVYGIERARRERGGMELPGNTRCLFRLPEEGGGGARSGTSGVGAGRGRSGSAGGRGNLPGAYSVPGTPMTGTYPPVSPQPLHHQQQQNVNTTTTNPIISITGTHSPSPGTPTPTPYSPPQDTLSSTTLPPPTLDFSHFIDPTPLTVHPSLPLETVMEIFKKIGPRVILIEHRGTLCGCVTIKDCLAYQAKVENLEGASPHVGGGGEGGREREREREMEERSMEWLWEWIVWLVQWGGWKLWLTGRRPDSPGSSILMFSEDEESEREGEDAGEEEEELVVIRRP